MRHGVSGLDRHGGPHSRGQGNVQRGTCLRIVDIGPGTRDDIEPPKIRIREQRCLPLGIDHRLRAQWNEYLRRLLNIFSACEPSRRDTHNGEDSLIQRNGLTKCAEAISRTLAATNHR